MNEYKAVGVVTAQKIVKIFRDRNNGYDLEGVLIGATEFVPLGIEWQDAHRPEVGGYLIISGGRTLFSPKDEFEHAYVKYNGYGRELLEESEPMWAQIFSFAHLKEPLQSVSRPFCELAASMMESLPRNAERTVMLRKLREAKDCAVTAFILKS